MINLCSYYNELFQQIEKHISKEYNAFTSINFELFEKVNFYLIDKALNKEQNLLIKTIQKNEKSNIYVPIVLSAALSLFFKNYCSTDINYKVGDVLQKSGIRYKILQYNQGIYKLEYTVKGVKTISECKEHLISRYSVVNAKLSNRKVKATLNEFKKFFSEVFKTENFPTQFKYKVAIILEWNDFKAELREQNSVDFELLKTIPIQRFKKNGETYNCSLPIDPMIYLVPDYYTYQDYVKDNYEIDAVILVGKNKYRSEFYEALENDIESEEVTNVVIIGSASIKDNTDTFVEWNWTQPEISYLKNRQDAVINSSLIEDNNFSKAVDNYYNFLSEVESKYFTNLIDIKRFKKLLFSLVIPNENSRLINYREWVKNLIHKETESVINDILIAQNIDNAEISKSTELLIEEIFNSFSNTKLIRLESLKDTNIILVPKRHLEIWEKEFQNNSIKLMSINQFLNSQSNYRKRKEVVLLSIFGYKRTPFHLVELLLSFPHTYNFLLYDEEEQVLQEVLNRNSNLENKEYGSLHRKKLTGIEYKYEEKPENISDLIDSIVGNAEGERKQYDYEGIENVNYSLSFEENNEEFIYDGSKSVLLHKENRKEQIFNLLVGDKVRIYTNYTKEKLYEIALAEDLEGRFTEIDISARLWKQCLQDYFISKQQKNINYSKEDLLSELLSYGLKVTSISTISNWLFKDRDMFPSSESSLFSIRQLIRCEILNENYKNIIEARRLYRGIMQSLGRNLSEEVMDYVISNKKSKGKILQTFTDAEIHTFVDKSLPLFTIKSKTISDEEETN